MTPPSQNPSCSVGSWMRGRDIPSQPRKRSHGHLESAPCPRCQRQCPTGARDPGKGGVSAAPQAPVPPRSTHTRCGASDAHPGAPACLRPTRSISRRLPKDSSKMPHGSQDGRHHRRWGESGVPRVAVAAGTGAEPRLTGWRAPGSAGRMLWPVRAYTPDAHARGALQPSGCKGCRPPQDPRMLWVPKQGSCKSPIRWDPHAAAQPALSEGPFPASAALDGARRAGGLLSASGRNWVRPGVQLSPTTRTFSMTGLTGIQSESQIPQDPQGTKQSHW